MAVHFNGSQADEWANQAGLSPRSSVYTAILRREQRILPALDGIVYLSRYMQRTLENAIPGLPEVPSTVVPNFVPAPEPGARVPTTADLISIGTLEPRKNQAYLLRVVQAANRFGHRYTLTLVGDGPDRAMLESLADDLGVRDQVRFLGFEPNARRLLPAHRAYVHAARFENMPLVLIEALAAGCPVFAPAVGGVPEVYEEGVEGYHWRLEDPNEGARMLIHVLEDAERWELMCQAARRRFDTGFESSAVAERLRRFLIA
jgi:glycosyltransferase involved in cell wall biosynthesis